MNKPLPTDAIDLECQPEPEADHIDGDELAQIWQVLEFEEKTAVRDRAIVAVSYQLALKSVIFRICKLSVIKAFVHFKITVRNATWYQSRVTCVRGIKSKGVFKQAAAEAYLKAVSEDEDEKN